jgi:hypothetical protein
MNGYLQHLAARALGQVSVAKPRLTPLFGDASVDPVDGMRTTGFEVATAPEPEPTPFGAQQATAMNEPQELPTATNSQEQTVVAVRERPALGASPPVDIEVPGDVLPSAQFPKRPISSIASVVPTPSPSPPSLELSSNEERHAASSDDRRQSQSRPTVKDASTTRSDGATDLQVAQIVHANDPNRSHVTSDGPMASMLISGKVSGPIATGESSWDSTSIAEPSHSITQGANVTQPASPAPIAQNNRNPRVAPPMSSHTDRSSGTFTHAPFTIQPQLRPDMAPSTVNVTIGRVEVRATPSAQPAAKPRRSALSPTSLDQYLSRRDRGARA